MLKKVIQSRKRALRHKPEGVASEKVDILVVDDVPEKLIALEAVLSELNQTIIKASSGKDALRLLLQQDFALILLDVNMPGMDGFETAALIRQRKNSEHTPIIFMSAVDSSEIHLAKGYSLGAVDYIFSPIVPDVLKTKVAVFVELYKRTEQVKKRVQERTAELLAINTALQQEILERKRTEARLEEANKELQILNQVRSDFTSMVSHELRTPLTAIKEGITLVLDEIEGPLTDSQRETLSITKKSVDRLARLIQNVLTFSKMESGQFQADFEQTNIIALTKEVSELMTLAAHKKGVGFEHHLPRSPLHALCDADKLKQIMINLVDNALKFTDAGGRVSLRLIPKTTQFIIEVTDSGIGIHPKDQHKIFDMFNQSAYASSRKAGGVGMGLAICKKLAELHRGTIEVESSFGKGSTFRVALPLLSKADVKIGQECNPLLPSAQPLPTPWHEAANTRPCATQSG